MNIIKNNIFSHASLLVCFSFFLFPFSFLLVSCSSTTETDEGVTFSGTVTLEGETDYSGVKISLYKPVELDTALVRINQEYPNIGVQISQETEFDHREVESKYSTNSKSDGFWKIENVSPDTYHLVAEKDGFGWKYIYEANTSDTQAFTLIKSNNLNGVIDTGVIVETGQFLVIEGDVVFTQNSSLEFKGDNTILFAENKKLTIMGGLITNASGYLKMTSIDLENKGKGVVIDKEGEVNLQYLYMSHLNNPIVFENNPNLTIELERSLIKKCSNGIYVKNKLVSIKNCLFSLINEYAVEILMDFSITKNIIKRSGGILLLDNSGVLKNNLFESNEIALIPYKGNIIIKNNDFDKNKISIAVNSSNCEITFNNFHKNGLDIELNRNYVQMPIFDYSNPNIQYNNFFKSDTAVSILGKNSLYSGGIYTGIGINKDLVTPNCYWEFESEFFIDQRIYDAKDNAGLQYYILFNPIVSIPVSNAGIQF